MKVSERIAELRLEVQSLTDQLAQYRRYMVALRAKFGDAAVNQAIYEAQPIRREDYRDHLDY